MTNNNSLVVLENATRMLAEVKDARDAKKLMDMAGAAEHYAKKAQLSQDAIDYAHTIKIEAQKMLGEFLQKSIDHKGGRPDKNGTKEEPLLSDLGLSKKVSSESQFLASVAANKPEGCLTVVENKE